MSRSRAIEVALVALLLVGGAAVRVRVARGGWVYAGSDSYAYLKLGDEWRAHGRFALAPDAPLEWYRRPLYPAFLRAVRGAHEGTSGDVGWTRIEHAQLAIDLLMGLLAFLVARRLGGRLAGFVALVLAMLYPPTVLYSCVVLTEPMMAALTMATVACLILGRARPRLWFPVAAAGVGLASYLRPDGPLLAIAFVPALFYVDGWRRRGVAAALSLLTFVVLFAPWPLRNLARFGRPHLADGMVDRYGHDVPHYAGFWRWLQTWAQDDKPAAQPQSCFYNMKCAPSVDMFDAHGAFAAPGTSADAERATVEELLALRAGDGVSVEVSNGFLALARKRRATHPFRVAVTLPVERAWAMWTAPQDEVLQNPAWRPWPRVSGAILPYLARSSLLLLAGVVLSSLALLVSRRARLPAAILVATIAARTVVLAGSAFCLPRYLIPLYPLCFVLIGAGIALAYDALGRVSAARSA